MYLSRPLDDKGPRGLALLFLLHEYMCVLFEPIFIQCHLVFYLTLVTGNH